MSYRRSQWPRGVRRGSAAARLLGSWVRIPPGAWMSVSCTVFVLSGKGLCGGLIPRPEESYRVCCAFECDQVKIKTLYTCCEQVGRRGKDYERSINTSLKTTVTLTFLVTFSMTAYFKGYNTWCYNDVMEGSFVDDDCDFILRFPVSECCFIPPLRPLSFIN
jgi:hypothetical protein